MVRAEYRKLIKGRMIQIAVPVLTAMFIISTLTGCGEGAGLVNGINFGKDVEVTMMVSEIAPGEEWRELGKMQSSSELRSDMDQIFKVVSEDGRKYGILYTTPEKQGTNNSCLLYALQNKQIGNYLNETSELAIAQAVTNRYSSEEASVENAICRYYELLGMKDEKYDGSKVVSRIEAMSAVYKATNPKPSVLKDSARYQFGTQAGATAERVASYMDDTAYLSTRDGSLNSTTASEAMTKGEAVYMIMNHLFKDEVINAKLEMLEGKAVDTGIESGAEYIDKQGKRQVSKDAAIGTQAGKLKYAMDNTALDIDMAKAYEVAISCGVCNNGTEVDEWDDPITTSELIKLIMNACKAYGAIYGGPDGVSADYTAAVALKEQSAGSNVAGVAAIEEGSIEAEEEAEAIMEQEEADYKEADEKGESITAQEIIAASKAVSDSDNETDASGKVKEQVDELAQRTEPADKKMFATQNCNVRCGDSTNYEKVGNLGWAEEVHVVGYSSEGWYKIELGEGNYGYVSKKLLSDTKPVQEQKKAETPTQQAAPAVQTAPAAPAGSGRASWRSNTHKEAIVVENPGYTQGDFTF